MSYFYGGHSRFACLWLSSLRPLSIFVEEYAPKAAIVVSNERAERRVGKIRVLPWRSFLDELWAGGLIS